jgi:uncharacterized protein (TIGR00251 family)
LSSYSAEADSRTPWRRVGADGSIMLEIHVQPGAKRTEVVGVHGGALKIRVAAPPVEGKANEELRRFLADAFLVPRRNVTLVRGVSSHRKTLHIASPAARPDRNWGA